MAKADPARSHVKKEVPPPITSRPADRPDPGDRQTLAERLQPYFRAELVLPAVILFLLGLPVFCRLIAAADERSIYSDHMAHLHLAYFLAAKGEYPPHPFYHLCVVVLSFGNNLYALAGMAAFILAASLATRAYLSALLFTSGNRPSLAVIVAACFALTLVMPLPNWWDPGSRFIPKEAGNFLKEMPSSWWNFPSAFRGQIAPNVWHNPTGIFAMPFALLVFLTGLRALEVPRLSTCGLAGGAMVLSLLAKPNYVLAFAPCFGITLVVVLALAVRAGRVSAGGAIGYAGVAFGPALAVLAIQYVKAFETGQPGGSGVVLAPFAAWSLVSRNIPASVVPGLAFPLTVAVFNLRQIVREPRLALAWAVMGVSLLQYALLAESGERLQHNNFGWGPVLASQVLFVACCDFLLRQRANIGRAVAFGVLGLQVLSGCVCLARCLIVPSMENIF